MRNHRKLAKPSRGGGLGRAPAAGRAVVAAVLALAAAGAAQGQTRLGPAELDQVHGGAFSLSRAMSSTSATGETAASTTIATGEGGVGVVDLSQYLGLWFTRGALTPDAAETARAAAPSVETMAFQDVSLATPQSPQATPAAAIPVVSMTATASGDAAMSSVKLTTDAASASGVSIATACCAPAATVATGAVAAPDLGALIATTPLTNSPWGWLLQSTSLQYLSLY